MTPDKFIAKPIRKIFQWLRIIFYKIISDARPSGSGAFFLQPVFCSGLGKIVLDNCHIGVQPSPRAWDSYCHLEARESSAVIYIGPDVWLNNSAILIAERTSIRIDRGCLIGSFVQIYDSDFHGLDPNSRTNGSHSCSPVHLEENVFVGGSVTILKGVTIGKNSVIGAGSVVTTDIPKNCIAAGVPAKILRQIII